MANTHGGISAVGIKENDNRSVIHIALSTFEDKAVTNDEVKKFISLSHHYEEIHSSEYPDESYEAFCSSNDRSEEAKD